MTRSTTAREGENESPSFIFPERRRSKVFETLPTELTAQILFI